MPNLTDAEITALAREAFREFLFAPATDSGLEAIEEAMHAAGVPLAPGTACRFDFRAGGCEVVLALADGRALRIHGQSVAEIEDPRDVGRFHAAIHPA